MLHRYAEARQIGDGLADRAVEALGAAGRPRRTGGREPVGAGPRRGLVELIVARRRRRRRAARCCTSGRPRPSSAGSPTPGWPPASSPSSSTSRRYTAASILDAGTGEVLFATARDGGGRLVGPDARAELERADGRRTASRRRARCGCARSPGRKVLARVDDVPGYGWRAWSPPAAARPAIPSVAATPAALAHERPRHRRARRASASSTAATSATPTTGARPTATCRSRAAASWPPRSSRPARCAAGSASCTPRPTATSRSRTSSSCGPASGSCGSRRRSTTAAATTACASTCPLPAPADHQRGRVRVRRRHRGLTAEGGPTELGLPTFPSRRFVRAGGLTVVHEGAPRVRARRHRATARPTSSPSRCCAARHALAGPDGHPAAAGRAVRPPRGPAAADRRRRCGGASPRATTRSLRPGRRRLPARCGRRAAAPAAR